MSRTSEDIVMDVLNTIERRDLARLPGLYHPEVEFSWPPGLPYGGVFRGSAIGEMNASFAATWGPLQPSERERRLDPRVVASSGGDVVVNYHWRALDKAGRRFETETLAHYSVRDDRLARAQMFYFDLAGMLRYLNEVPR